MDGLNRRSSHIEFWLFRRVSLDGGPEPNNDKNNLKCRSGWVAMPFMEVEMEPPCRVSCRQDESSSREKRQRRVG